MQTMVMRGPGRAHGGGTKASVSMALGMTHSFDGGSWARRSVLSALVWETQMIFPTLVSVNCSNLLVTMLLTSLKPKSECSVKTVCLKS